MSVALPPGHAELVAELFRAAGNWLPAETLDRSPQAAGGDPLLAVVARRKEN